MASSKQQQNSQNLSNPKNFWKRSAQAFEKLGITVTEPGEPQEPTGKFSVTFFPRKTPIPPKANDFVFDTPEQRTLRSRARNH